jgi:protein-disulfide isomerase
MRRLLGLLLLTGVAFAATSADAPVVGVPVTTEGGDAAVLTTGTDDAWRGNPDARVTVVQFSDIECVYCRSMFAQTSRLFDVYGDVVLFVFEHFPMDPDCNPGVANRKHTHACDAAAAAVCANEQGRFWSFAAVALKNQHMLEAPALRLMAERSGLDLLRYDACVSAPATAATVRADAERGAKLGIHGTPRVFVGGRLFRSGASLREMGEALEAALGSSLGTSRVARLDEPEEPFPPIPADLPTMEPVQVAGRTVWIDAFEASITEGRATTARHAVPGTRVSWFRARDACTSAGKRLCTEEEWISACQGAPAADDDGAGQFADDLIEGTAYPYGDDYEAGRCWSDHAGDAPSEWRPVYTGEMPGCVTPGRVYDLTGNVEEWVGGSPEQAVLLGGAFDTTEDHARCYRRNDIFGAGYASLRTGFRCCSDTAPSR